MSPKLHVLDTYSKVVVVPCDWHRMKAIETQRFCEFKLILKCLKWQRGTQSSQ